MAAIKPKSRNNRLLALSAATLALSLASLNTPASESYQDWLRSQSSGTAEMEREFKAYRSAQDQAFADHLKAEWQEFQVFQGKVRDPNPKPKLIPKAPVLVKAPPVTEPKPLELPAQQTQPPVIAPPIKIPPAEPIVMAPPPPPPPPRVKPAEITHDEISLSFYGNTVNFPYDPQWRSLRVGAINPKNIAAFWDQISASRYQPTVQAIAQARRDLRLDDWGHAMLWREIAKAMRPHQSAEQDLLLWYFLVKSGVDVRLGYSGSQIYLFVAVKQPVYAASFIKFGPTTYYALLSADRGKKLNSFHTYEANYPAPLKPIDLTSASLAFSQTSRTAKKVNFEFQGRQVKLDLAYDRRLVEYMNSFPQMDFELYFSTQGSTSAREPLLAALRQQMQGMREEESVNFLLAFVQKGFAYKTDQDQFGYEKYFFVEEALHYPYSDCEDRSALFSWLVRELLGLKTVGLHYPGHMTTGVALKTSNNTGASIEWKGERYVIADPTYINASIGMAMPSYANTKPLRVIATQ